MSTHRHESPRARPTDERSVDEGNVGHGAAGGILEGVGLYIPLRVGNNKEERERERERENFTKLRGSEDNEQPKQI